MPLGGKDAGGLPLDGLGDAVIRGGGDGKIGGKAICPPGVVGVDQHAGKDNLSV